jgi:NADP-dependent 3-hydroxy acid dehydrogenase YdfG
MPQPLEGRVAAVTGASAGIGEATALALAEAGAAVAVGARRADRLAGLVERIEQGGGRALAVPVDVADREQAHAFVDTAKSELGRLDVLVNNAGVMLLGPFEPQDPDEWRRMMDVNVYGLLHCTQAALPVMREQGSGHIVNVSSVAGRYAAAENAVYNFTKWGVTGFSEALRQEGREHGIRVTCLEPGYVETELRESLSEAGRAQQEGVRDLMDEPLTSDDMARIIVFCVSQPQRVSLSEILVRPSTQVR